MVNKEPNFFSAFGEFCWPDVLWSSWCRSLIEITNWFWCTCLWNQRGYILYTVEGGQRAIIFSRIGGMQMHTVLSEGLHFRIPWFQYPIIYDIRAKPQKCKISSLTGSKGSRELQDLRCHWAS
ncbi:prohibitin-2b, partial [Tachysurus fulvidraco]|uniref:prohibitin-2b n=1 Tax=Tachysurus fulvidraco TaxID=1234273 RepID=UPI001FEDCDA0